MQSLVEQTTLREEMLCRIGPKFLMSNLFGRSYCGIAVCSSITNTIATVFI